jgi:hypothetical protein
VKIFRPLPHTGAPAEIKEVHPGKTHADPLWGDRIMWRIKRERPPCLYE